MHLSDIAKALIVGAIAFAIDFLVVFVLLGGYAMLLNPGQTQAFYDARAPEIALWSTRIVGPLLLLVFAWWFCRWGKCRSALGFALLVFTGYALADIAAGLALDAGATLFTTRFVGSMAIKFAGAMLGGLIGLALRRRDSATVDPE